MKTWIEKIEEDKMPISLFIFGNRALAGLGCI